MPLALPRDCEPQELPWHRKVSGRVETKIFFGNFILGFWKLFEESANFSFSLSVVSKNSFGIQVNTVVICILLKSRLPYRSRLSFMNFKKKEHFKFRTNLKQNV
jgi:hypothetical protein